jgi:hypothetical protein
MTFRQRLVNRLDEFYEAPCFSNRKEYKVKIAFGIWGGLGLFFNTLNLLTFLISPATEPVRGTAMSRQSC